MGRAGPLIAVESLSRFRGPHLQANALGGLSDRALQRIAEIADERDLRTRAAKAFLGLERFH